MPISSQSLDHRVKQYRDGPNPRDANAYAMQRGNADAATWRAAYAEYVAAQKRASAALRAHAETHAKLGADHPDTIAAAEASIKAGEDFRSACRAYNRVTAQLPRIKK